MDDAGVQAPFGHLDLAQQAILAVEQQGEKDFFAAVAETFVKMGEDLGGRREALAVAQRGGRQPAASSPTANRSRLGRTDAGKYAQFRSRGRGQGTQ